MADPGVRSRSELIYILRLGRRESPAAWVQSSINSLRKGKIMQAAYITHASRPADMPEAGHYRMEHLGPFQWVVVDTRTGRQGWVRKSEAEARAEIASLEIRNMMCH